MSEIGQEAAPQAVDRKELLAQQLTELETPSTETVTPEPTQSERARDEKGKFVAKDPAPEAAPVVQAEAPAAVEPPAWSKAPASWKKDYHTGWETLPENYRQYIHDREAQMRAGVEPLLPKAELADKISKVSEPYINTIRGLGLDLPQAVEGLMRVDHQLRTLPYEQKLQTIIGVAKSYGIDLTGQAQTAQNAYDPNFQALQNELLNIKGQFNSFTQQQEMAQQAAAQQEIQKFAATAEHFEEVKPLMAKLLQGGLADGIQDAYEQAIRLTPDIFEKQLAAKQAAAEAERVKAADAAAKKAKAAAVSVKSATPGSSKPTNAQDRRSMLREQLDSVSDRL